MLDDIYQVITGYKCQNNIWGNGGLCLHIYLKWPLVIMSLLFLQINIVIFSINKDKIKSF